MKANEIPEKIYVTNYSSEVRYNWHDERLAVNDIEYTRTDALIEKAWEWIEDNILSSNQQDKSRLYYENFKNYMKGE
jgi:hypothetical protein